VADRASESPNSGALVAGQGPESLIPGASTVGRAPELPNIDAPVAGVGSSHVARYITLSDGLAGVSRRHCTFVRDGDELVLLDHSTFGTYVNGERVRERVRVHAGDRVRLGEPGVELALIAVGEIAAATT
jgi:pSer/pThr/pTyr-binding forkhead associated (FHA) protein